MGEKDLIWHMLNSYRSGTIETSLLATDGNNNPNAMNAVFAVFPRIAASLNAPRETLAGGELKNPTF